MPRAPGECPRPGGGFLRRQATGGRRKHALTPPSRTEEWISEGSWLVELLLPRTDAGVAAQLALVLVVSALLLWRVRRQPDLRFFVLSCSVFVLGLFMVRALH